MFFVGFFFLNICFSLSWDYGHSAIIIILEHTIIKVARDGTEKNKNQLELQSGETNVCVCHKEWTCKERKRI